jgi:Rieske Fe-S protein
MMSDATAANESTARRSFFARLGAIVLGGILTVFPFAAGWGVFSAPLRRRSTAPDGGKVPEAEGFVPICPLDSLPADGSPHAFAVVADIVDAWSRAVNERIGEVFLSRTEKDGKPHVTAFTATCPHLGCAVEFDAAEERFECPCHESGFAKDGKKLFGPSLRDLDRLDAEVRDEGGTQQVWVRFERFRAGVAERKPV